MRCNGDDLSSPGSVTTCSAGPVSEAVSCRLFCIPVMAGRSMAGRSMSGGSMSEGSMSEGSRNRNFSEETAALFTELPLSAVSLSDSNSDGVSAIFSRLLLAALPAFCEVDLAWDGSCDAVSRAEIVSFRIELNAFSLPVPKAAGELDCCAGCEKGRRGAIEAIECHSSCIVENVVLSSVAFCLEI